MLFRSSGREIANNSTIRNGERAIEKDGETKKRVDMHIKIDSMMIDDVESRFFIALHHS